MPVLAITSTKANKLMAVVFGYSCHATCTDDGTIHGDYPGYAQAKIEEAHQSEGTVALFLNGCERSWADTALPAGLDANVWFPPRKCGRGRACAKNPPKW